MKAKYELKVRGVLGGAWGDQREVTIPNRKLRWEDDEITYEADPEHVRKLVEGIGLLADSNGLEKPAVKQAVEDVGDPHWNEELDPDDARLFRALSARANYLSQDRADVQYAAKDPCRHMAAPTLATCGKLNRLVRYSLQFPRLSRSRGTRARRTPSTCSPTPIWRNVSVLGDPRPGRRHRRRIGDKALELDAGDGDPLEWRGGVSDLGKGRLRFRSVASASFRTRGPSAIGDSHLSGPPSLNTRLHWCATGRSRAPRTPRVRLNTGAALACDLGCEMRLIIHVDSSTARSIANRTGVGKLRHTETRVLWVQQAVRECRFALCRVAGKDNPADILTKPMSLDEMRGKLSGIGAIVHARGEPERRRWADYSLSRASLRRVSDVRQT